MQLRGTPDHTPAYIVETLIKVMQTSPVDDFNLLLCTL